MTTTIELPALAKELDALEPLNINDTKMCFDTSPLSSTEKRMFEHHETIINQGKNAVVEVGRSLLAIQRGRLYREDFMSFNDYCQRKWGFGRQRGYELANAAAVGQEVSASGFQTDTLNERQLRAVARLKNADQRINALNRALELADGKKMTSRHIDAAVDELLGIPKPIIEVDDALVVGSSTCTISLNQSSEVTMQDVSQAIQSIRDIAITLKVHDRLEETLTRLERMVTHLLKEKSLEVKDFAGTAVAA